MKHLQKSLSLHKGKKILLEKQIIVELQWHEHLRNHKNMFQTGVVQANECLSKCQVRRHDRYIFSIFINMKVCCVCLLESP